LSGLDKTHADQAGAVRQQVPFAWAQGESEKRGARVSQRTDGLTGRAMRVEGVGNAVPRASTPPSWSRQRPAPSVRRSDEERERRHRERAIAAWLRSLNR
jgi:hypothetical protein